MSAKDDQYKQTRAIFAPKLTDEQRIARTEAENAFEARLKRARLPKDHPKYLPYSEAVKVALRAYDRAKEDY